MKLKLHLVVNNPPRTLKLNREKEQNTKSLKKKNMEQKNSSRSVMEKSFLYLLLKCSNFKGRSWSSETSNMFLYKDVNFLYCSLMLLLHIRFMTLRGKGWKLLIILQLSWFCAIWTRLLSIRILYEVTHICGIMKTCLCSRLKPEKKDRFWTMMGWFDVNLCGWMYTVCIWITVRNSQKKSHR